MDPLRTYDYLTLVRRRMFDVIRPLNESAHSREFPIGPGTLGRTLTHIMISEWYYIARLERRDVPPYAAWPIRAEAPPVFEELEAEWSRQAAATRAALAAVRNWNEVFEYRVTDDDGREVIVTATPADLFTQLALHEMHHRAQALNMLRQLGVVFEGDLDFNAIMMKRRPADS